MALKPIPPRQVQRQSAHAAMIAQAEAEAAERAAAEKKAKRNAKDEETA